MLTAPGGHDGANKASSLDPAALRVAIQGELGSNSHLAALNAVAEGRMAFGSQPGEPTGSAPVILPCAQSADVFERLEDGIADLAVLPIENSLHGSVFEHYDLLLRSGVLIGGETMLRVRHNVIVAPGVRLEDLRRILSHPVALSQCRRWLREHAGIEAVPYYDTAGSVKEVVRTGSRDSAAIAPKLAAQEYGAEILVGGIEDHSANYTRFYLLMPPASPLKRPDADKASIAFSLEHRPGSLIEALEVFRSAGLNLTKIESRPVPGSPWEYVFFVDVRFEHASDLEQALQQLQTRCEMVKELGRYVAAALPLT